MPLARVRHILVKSEAECEQIKKALQEGGDFAALARQHSACPSGRKGGFLGEFGPGQMVAEFDHVCFNAPVGELQGPVQTQFGFHLIDVLSRS